LEAAEAAEAIERKEKRLAPAHKEEVSNVQALKMRQTIGNSLNDFLSRRIAGRLDERKAGGGLGSDHHLRTYKQRLTYDKCTMDAGSTDSA
jgi:hypothetical protein